MNLICVLSGCVLPAMAAHEQERTRRANVQYGKNLHSQQVAEGIQLSDDAIDPAESDLGGPEQGWTLGVLLE
jgi:hypothetical protein